MIGITIGIGGDWPQVAHRAAKRMQAMTGLECIVIDHPTDWDPVHPSWLKCGIIDRFPDLDDFLVFDADIVCLKPWDPEKLHESLGRPFMAVCDDNSKPVYDECCAHRLPFPDWYINGGLTIFSRKHAPLWRAVQKHHPRFGRWLEQTALNHELLEQRVEIVRLPRRFNTLAHNGGVKTPLDRIINLHLCSIGDAAKISELQQSLLCERA